MVKRYRFRPTNTREAVQWSGFNEEEIRAFTHPETFEVDSANRNLLIHTKQGRATARVGDWVLKSQLDFYPCSKEVFELSYEEVPADTSDKVAALL